MDLQISVILLLSFSLAATIKGEKTEEDRTFRKEHSGRNVQEGTFSKWCKVTVRKWCKVMVSKWCKVMVSKWYNMTVSKLCKVTVSKWCNMTVSKWCKVMVSKWCLRCYTVVQSLEDPLALL